MSFLASNVWASDITIKKGNTASFTYKVVTPPTTTPVSLILVKEFLRISLIGLIFYLQVLIPIIIMPPFVN